MSHFSDRPVSRSDTAWIVQLHQADHAEGFIVVPTEESVLRALEYADSEQRIVLDEHEEPAGMWRAAIVDNWLVEIRLILSAVQGRGAGRWALRRILTWAFEERGAHRVCLDVTVNNAVARTLYERHGFRWEGTFRDGFRTSDGTYENLCHYGILAHEYRSGAAERRRAR